MIGFLENVIGFLENVIRFLENMIGDSKNVIEFPKQKILDLLNSHLHLTWWDNKQLNINQRYQKLQKNAKRLRLHKGWRKRLG